MRHVTGLLQGRARHVVLLPVNLAVICQRQGRHRLRLGSGEGDVQHFAAGIWRTGRRVGGDCAGQVCLGLELHQDGLALVLALVLRSRPVDHLRVGLGVLLIWILLVGRSLIQLILGQI